MSEWVFAHGALDDGDWQTAVLPGEGATGRLGWRHTSLREATIVPDGFVTHDTGDEEVIVVPLSGAWTVTVGDGEFRLAGRQSVWAGPTDVLYVPPGQRITVTNHGDESGRVALAGAVVPQGAGREREVVHISAADVPVELRGAGLATREVRNFGVPGVLDAERVIACEVVTPAGNWSSWPAHKHDEQVPGRETELEEIYWFDVAAEGAAPAGADPVGYLRMHTTARDTDVAAGVQPTLDGEVGGIDVLAEVRSGDTVLVPHGWHGPAMAPPGYDLYYLNVMAGPGPERAWLICDDPAHAWVRTQWPSQPTDPRLPMGGQ